MSQSRTSETSSGFSSAIGKLRALNLAERGWPTRASDIFFREDMT